jgi:hypothetical protein
MAGSEATTARHTLGPWSVDPLRIGTRWNVGTEDTDVALASQLIGDDKPQTQRSANARLIASAPEMWEMMASLSELVSEYRHASPNLFYARIDALAKDARAILARIDGQVEGGVLRNG